MKRIIVCDSGLGGLNIASHFFRNPDSEKCELIFFNAYPGFGHGFNTLADEHAKEELFREVLNSMEKFAPDLCLIACNTLSIIYESLRKRYTPSFPVEVIVDDAVSGMIKALRENPAGSLLILGTQTTVGSGYYRDRLLQRGIASERLCGLACPGMATLLENDPAAPEVRNRIRQYAESAIKLFENRPDKLLLSLCCTHFEFAGSAWKEIFSDIFACPIEIINPNERMKSDFSAQNFRYLARIGFLPGAREKMVQYFKKRTPAIASALSGAQADPSLFAFQETE